MAYSLKIKKILFLIILCFVSNLFCQKDIDIKYLQDNFSFEELKQIQYLKKDSLNIDKNINDKYLDILNFVSLKQINEAIFTIYGNDNRLDIEDTYNIEAIKNSKGIGILLNYKDFKKNNDTLNYVLSTKKFKERINLCKSVKFREQPTLTNICTVFGISDKYLLTAAHCLNNKNIKNLRVAFGYSKNNNKIFTSLKKKNIYSIKLIKKGNWKDDYALLKLEKPSDNLPKERQLVLNTSSKKHYNKDIYIIGHPYGLPLKYSDGKLLEDNNTNYYNAHINTISGNSGSPIFNYKNEVIGILSMGKTVTFTKDNILDCYNMYNYKENAFNNEKIYKLHFIKDLLTNKI